MKALIAQATTSPDWLGFLSGAGVAGVVLAWFMFRAESRSKEVERRMVGIENAANRTTRAILLLVLSLEHATEAAKAEGNALLNEIEESERRRKGSQEDER